jgi:DNA-binding transcriptional LysR family regulator
MSLPDLNLLITLDAVLVEGSVTRAAARLRLSPSAMSRALARLRETTGDPLLVRVGRGLVPTPRALELREQVGELLAHAKAVLRPADQIDLKRLVRTFTLRSRDGFVENFGAALIQRVSQAAPGVRLCFVQKPDKEAAALRAGAVDLETGVVDGNTAPEMRTQRLFDDRFIGVVRKGHRLSKGTVSASRYAQARHIGLSMHGPYKGQVDDELARRGLEREHVATVGGFGAALALVRGSDLVATVPEHHTGILRQGLHSFSLPVPTPPITVSMLWHPRLENDQAHCWLRSLVRDVCSHALEQVDVKPAHAEFLGAAP